MRLLDDYTNGRITVQILGDSIMNADTVPFEQRWHQMLKSSFESSGTQFETWVGGAINGSKTSDYIPGGQYNAHLEFCVHNPSLVIMDWRINDWWGNMSLESYRNYYDMLISRVKELSPTSDILLINTPWVYNSEVLGSHPVPEKSYTQKMKLVAAQHRVPVLDLEWFFPGDDPCGFYVPDRIHHSRAGQYVIYTAVRSYLLGLMKGATPVATANLCNVR